MSQQTFPGVTLGEKSITFERTFDAPRDLVFQMFSDGEHLKKWWGPHPWDVNVSKMDFREGGTWLYSMKGPEGPEAFGKSVYREIVPGERIVFDDLFTDEEGNVNPDMPTGTTTITFEDLGGRTRVTITAGHPSEEALQAVVQMGMIEGMSQALDQLTALLKQA